MDEAEEDMAMVMATVVDDSSDVGENANVDVDTNEEDRGKIAMDSTYNYNVSLIVLQCSCGLRYSSSL